MAHKASDIAIADHPRYSKMNSLNSTQLPLQTKIPTADSFEMDSYAKGLAAMLRDSSLPVPLLMGIHGKFGSGKTQLIKAVLWKVRRICGFSCNNMGRPLKQAEVNWRYKFCCCNVPFFGYLLLLFGIVVTVALAVVSFMGLASVMCRYDQRNASGSQNATSDNSEHLHPGIKDALWAAAAFTIGSLMFIIVTGLVLCCCRSNVVRSAANQWLQLKTILLMLFCESPPPPVTAKHDKVHVIPVVFNAWEYAGCDVLWAGIIKNMFHQVEQVFGKWKLRLYRTFPRHALSHEHDLSVVELGTSKDISTYFGESLRSSKDAKIEMGTNLGNSEEKTLTVTVHTAKLAHIPYPVLAAVGFGVVTTSITVLILFELADEHPERIQKYIQTAAGLLLGVTVVSQLGNVFSFLKTSLSSQASQLDSAVKKMKGPDLSNDLGFMHTVKLEVQKITGFVKLMERLYQKKFRILIVIDDLDKCGSSRVLSILEAINVLLSDEDSLFATLVAIDHNVVSKAIVNERPDSSAYLKRLVHMRFCMPECSAIDMDKVLEKNFFPRKDEQRRVAKRCQPNIASNQRDSRGFSDCVDIAIAEMEKLGLLVSNTSVTEEALKSKTRHKLTKLAMQEMKKRVHILPTSFQDLRHLCNMVFFTIYLWLDRMDFRGESFQALQLKLSDTCIKLTWWTIMTERWPYRCSWLLLHLEDMDDLAIKNAGGHRGDDFPHNQTTLPAIYKHVQDRLSEPEDWKLWIGNDNHQEHFDVALETFPLTAKHVKSFLPFTINLDRAVKHLISEHCKTKVARTCHLCIYAEEPARLPSTQSSLAEDTKAQDGRIMPNTAIPPNILERACLETSANVIEDERIMQLLYGGDNTPAERSPL